MAFTLKISATYNLPERTFYVTEIPVNEETWGDPDNPVRSDVDTAYIKIYNNGELLANEDVTIETSNPLGTGLDNTPIYIGKVNKDGIYSLSLVVNYTSGLETVETNSIPVILLVDNKIREYLSKFWVKHACAASSERQKGIFDVVSKLEAMWSGLKSLVATNKVAEAIDTIKLIESTIELNKTYLR